MPRRLLILGGSTLARQLTNTLAQHPEFHSVVCLTRTTAGYESADRQITGLICGTEALCTLIHEHCCDCLIDATHPFACEISGHALAVAKHTQIPLLTLQYGPWEKHDGDDWNQLECHHQAIEFLQSVAPDSHVFLSVGGSVIHEYAKLKHLQLTARCIRTHSPDKLSHVQIINAKGPFVLEQERELFRQQRFDYMVTKNSGGDATYNKIIAARENQVPVIMIKRPSYSTGKIFDNVACLITYIQKYKNDQSD